MEQNLQLAVLFGCGYLVSRLLVKAGIPERLVGGLFARRPSHARLVVYLVAATAALSFLIPNAVTVITVLPFVILVRDRIVENAPEQAARLTSSLALAVIYGANVGGMGSITGTPANGVLVLFSAFQDIPDEGLLRFDRWIVWGAPLVIVMVAASAVVICVSAGRGTVGERLPALADGVPGSALEPVAMRLAGSFLAAAFVLSAAMGIAGAQPLVAGATVLLAAALLGFLFLGRVEGRPILVLADCYRGLPVRGLVFVSTVVAIAVTLAALGLVDAIAARAAGALPDALDTRTAYVALALVTSFATELFSNTVIQLSLFETLQASAGSSPDLIELMLVVTLSCTCAFMSPLATGVNGLVFGELRGASLMRMLLAGAVMNCVGAVVVGLWVHALVR